MFINIAWKEKGERERAGFLPASNYSDFNLLGSIFVEEYALQDARRKLRCKKKRVNEFTVTRREGEKKMNVNQ